MCQTCDSCNSCDNSCQGSCEKSKQKVSESGLGQFHFRQERLATNDSFLTEDEWNKLLDYISSGYSLKGNPLALYSNGVYTYNNLSIKAGVNNNIFMSANMYNGAIAKMRYASTGEGTPGEYQKSGGANGDIIYASYFNDLEDYANNNFKVNYCNTCQVCNGCYNYCQGNNSCCNTSK